MGWALLEQKLNTSECNYFANYNTERTENNSFQFLTGATRSLKALFKVLPTDTFCVDCSSKPNSFISISSASS